jgi:hypothetical protein
MAYILGAITLPNPKSFKREFIETAAENLLIEGKTTKRVENRKERFILTFLNLTQAEVGSILSEYELEAVRTFQVNETNLTIGPTDVLVDIEEREYPLSGEEYRENLTLVLTEVS